MYSRIGIALTLSVQGMPEEWMVLLDRSGISAREQKNNPEVCVCVCVCVCVRVHVPTNCLLVAR